MLRLFAIAIAMAFALVGPTAAAPTAFSVSGIDDAMDLHGDPTGADLVLFVGGNQWFVLPALLSEFQGEHPEVKRVFYETLPPGVLAKQLESGGLQVGELELHVQPDVFLAGPNTLKTLHAKGLVAAPSVFAKTALALLVARGNPKHIESLADLGRPGVRVAMPNQVTEGVAREIREAYRKAGGPALETAIMVTKVRNGTTLFTEIHHRQTPAWLLSGKVDAGPVWYSEALYQVRIASGLQMVAIPAADNVMGTYAAAAVTRSAHAQAAHEFVGFMRSSQAQAIYRAYGFLPPP